MRLRDLSWPWAALLLAIPTLLMHAELVRHIDSAIAGDLGDPLLNTWILWWNAQQIPLTDAYWNAPAFAPAPNALALSETLLGLTWLTTPMQLMGASPLVAYNVMFIATPILNGLAAYWLCLTLTGRRDAALIGALAFAFAPYHASQVSHIQTRAMFFMPVALVGLHRHWRSGEWRWLGLFFAALVLNGLACGYLLLYFSIAVGIAIVWLTISTRQWIKGVAAATAFAVSMLALLPVILKYRAVQDEWNLHRSINEIERFSADLTSIWMASPNLVAWPLSTPPSQPELAGYPGIAIGLLLVAAAIAAISRRRPVTAPRWQQWLVRVFAALSLLGFVAGVIVFLTADAPYKVFGIAIDLALIAVLLSPRMTEQIRSQSIPALYLVTAAAAFLLALGPVGRVMGHRFWYKPPFAWLLTTPGFDSARVPALLSTIEVLCLAVLASFAITSLWPRATRTSLAMVAIIASLIVIDGWSRVPVVTVPAPPPAALSADLVIELPSYGWMENVQAMYRGMSHGRPVMNGYSGYLPPHFQRLQADLAKDCTRSIDGVRAGRSIDAVIWRNQPSAAVIDEELRVVWPDAVREELPAAIIYRQPRSSIENLRSISNLQSQVCNP